MNNTNNVIVKNILKNMYQHNMLLGDFACKDSEAIRNINIKEDFRSPFYRDIDKIIYSFSYRRYIDKTQVHSGIKNDLISNRAIHVQLVSKIARTIGRGLKLNEDLIEAASLGHDLGHVPYGHVGEKILNEISLRHNEGYFHHNVQSVRILEFLENNGLGSNITLQVLDAILCHNGEVLMNKYSPILKSWDEFVREYESSYLDEKTIRTISPMTLEGCVVRISDIIAYVGQDIEDAICLGLITRDKIPKSATKILGNNNSSIIETIVYDILLNSNDKNYIKLSESVFNALNELLKFNYKHIYLKANSQEQIYVYKKMFNDLFDYYLHELNKKDFDCDIYNVFLNNMNEKYKKTSTKSRIVIDFISGMTDEYFNMQYKKYILK